MIGGRILVEKRRKVQATSAMVPFVSVHGSNLGSDPAHHEVLEDSRHFFWRWRIQEFLYLISSPFPSPKPEREGVLRDLAAIGKFECECEFVPLLTWISEMREFVLLVLIFVVKCKPGAQALRMYFSSGSGIHWVNKENRAREVKNMK